LNTYVILRRSGWRSAEDLGAAAERSRKVGDELVRLHAGPEPSRHPGVLVAARLGLQAQPGGERDGLEPARLLLS
jgi:hypothetical protein